MGQRWEIEISDAKGRWGVPPIFSIRGPGVYETSEPIVAQEADIQDHVYARELKAGEKVRAETDESGEPGPTSGPLTVKDLRPKTVKLKTCDHCGKEYKWSHKRCAKRDRAEAKAKRAEKSKADKKPKAKREPKLRAKVLPITTGIGDSDEQD